MSWDSALRSFLRWHLPIGYLCIQFKQFFEAIGVVFEAATYVDAFDYFIISIALQFSGGIRNFSSAIKRGISN